MVFMAEPMPTGKISASPGNPGLLVRRSSAASAYCGAVRELIPLPGCPGLARPCGSSRTWPIRRTCLVHLVAPPAREFLAEGAGQLAECLFGASPCRAAIRAQCRLVIPRRQMVATAIG